MPFFICLHRWIQLATGGTASQVPSGTKRGPTTEMEPRRCRKILSHKWRGVTLRRRIQLPVLSVERCRNDTVWCLYVSSSVLYCTVRSATPLQGMKRASANPFFLQYWERNWSKSALRKGGEKIREVGRVILLAKREAKKKTSTVGAGGNAFRHFLHVMFAHLFGFKFLYKHL